MVNKGSQKCRVYEHLLKKIFKRLGVLIATSLNPCVYDGDFEKNQTAWDRIIVF